MLEVQPHVEGRIWRDGHFEAEALETVKLAQERSNATLRAADERFRAVTGSTRDGIVSADGSGRIIFWNTGAATIFGLSEEEALDYARTMWRTINKPNLLENVAPTRGRATLVLRKGPDHKVQRLSLRKL